MLHRITLHLGRTPTQPEGNARDGYEITAPLDAEGRLLAAEWHAAREKCRVRRFEPNEPDRHGWLLHRAGGEGGADVGPRAAAGIQQAHLRQPAKRVVVGIAPL